MFRFRVGIIKIFIFFIFSIVVGRLLYLQVYMSAVYSEKARKKNIHETRLDPIRGKILDRNYLPLAEEVSSFNIYFKPLKADIDKGYSELPADIKRYHKISGKWSRDRKRKREKELVTQLEKDIDQILKSPLLQKIYKISKLNKKVFTDRLLSVFKFTIRNWAQEPLIFNVPYEIAMAYEMEFSGDSFLMLEASMIRSYPQGKSLGHILGQVQLLQEDEVETLIYNGFLESKSLGKKLITLTSEEQQYLLSRRSMSNIIIGRTGLEQYYNLILRGESGEKCVERVLRKNSDGDVVTEYVTHYEIPAKMGHNLRLTIDSDLQKIVEDVFREPFKILVNGKTVTRPHVGSIVILDPKTGGVLAMMSGPDYDPNALIPPINESVLNDVILGKAKPNYIKGINRAINSTYPPGSPFKVFSSIMGLEEGLIKESDQVFCEGRLVNENGRDFRCNSRWGHQKVDVTKALKKSCNVYYYHLGLKLGTPKMRSWSKKFGFGLKTGIDLPHEKAGNLPKRKIINNRIIKNRAQDCFFAIGQDQVLVTPLQMAVGACVVANGGKKVRPHILMDEKSALYTPQDLHLKPQTLSAVRKGMYQVVNQPGGTAWGAKRAQSKEVVIAGKTGTADKTGRAPNSRYPSWEDAMYRRTSKSYEPHAWFIGFAPFENPKIAFAIVCERSGHGGDVASPLAKKIIEAYMRLLKKRQAEAPKG